MMSLVNYGSSDESDCDEFVADVVNQEVKPLVKQNKAKRIAAFSDLKDLNNDETDDIPNSKKFKTEFNSGADLFSILPKPKQYKNCVNDKPFVPTTLTKKSTNHVPLEEDYFTKNIQKNKSNNAVIGVSSNSVITNEDSDTSDLRNSIGNDFFGLQSEKSNSQEIMFSNNALPLEDAPLDFQNESPVIGKSNVINSKFTPGLLEPMPINKVKVRKRRSSIDETDERAVDEYNANPENVPITDSALQKLGVRKGERINIVDIDASIQLEDVSLMQTKMATQEVEYVSAKSRKNAVTSQQRQKHQLNWLIDQAKERELVLKNQWASSRLSRQQTQMKYGF